jgi:hypothetical protein
VPADAFEVDEIPSPRWEAALDLIRDGGPLVVVRRKIALGFQRYIGWPKADGLIHVSAFTSSAPSEPTDETKARDGEAASRLLSAVVAADPRLAEALDAFGTRFEYGYDYGNGAVRIGTIGEDGLIVLD